MFCSDHRRAQEAAASASLFLKRVKERNIAIERFRDGFLSHNGAEVKEYFEQIKIEFSPDLILTHYRSDLHQDHRLISELTWNTFRNHLILEYEIPKYDGDFGSPNFFVHLDPSQAQKKVQYIIKSFKSQNGKHWFDKETFLAVLRLRGMESCAPHHYAEAFYCRKMTI